MSQPTSLGWSPRCVLVTGVPGTGKSFVAEAIGRRLGAPVLAHDWAMSGLRPFAEIQAALERMELGHRVAGWSVLAALARSQLRVGRPVVLDGVAREAEVETCRAVAASEGGRLVVIATHCSDLALHRARVEGRRRAIPDWYELEWGHVEHALAAWEDPPGCDLRLDTSLRWAENETLLAPVFQ